MRTRASWPTDNAPYLIPRPFAARTKRDGAPPLSFEPARVLEVELSGPLPTLSQRDGRTGARYTRAFCLVRLHRAPLGLLYVELGDEGLSPSAWADTIWRALGSEINAHLRADGLPETSALGPAGLCHLDTPGCLRARERLLASAPSISVVIPTRDRTDLLARCVRSVLAVDYPAYEIIVVDNAPTSSASAAFVAQLRDTSRSVRYVREDRPGRSWARNRGLWEAEAEIVAFADDDVVVDPDWLSATAAGFRAAEDVGCVTGLILPTELESPAQAWLEEYGGFNKGFERRIYDLSAHRVDDPLYPYTAGIFGSGASMAFKTRVLREIGGFELALGSGTSSCGGEELAAFFRVVTHGHRLVYEPCAIVRHPHHREYERLCAQIHGYGMGLGAYLTACVVREPALLFEFARRTGPAARYLVRSGSHKNRKKSDEYPSELTILELKGLLKGPLAYARGRRAARRIGQTRVPSTPDDLSSVPRPAT